MAGHPLTDQEKQQIAAYGQAKDQSGLPKGPLPQNLLDRIAQQDECCDGTLKIECCCKCQPMMQFTIAAHIPGQPNDPAAGNASKGVIDAWANIGWKIVAYTLVDAGATYLLLLTIAI